MHVLLCTLLFGAVFANQLTVEEEEQICNPTCAVGFTCRKCLDGAYSCMANSLNVCCGCYAGRCWGCSSSSQCDINQPNWCFTPYNPTTTIVAVVVVMVFIMFGFSLAAWRRWRYGYWGWHSEPAVTVTHYNDTTYGYDHHHHHHHAHNTSYTPASGGYQVSGGGGGYAASGGYQVSGSSNTGYPASGGYQA